MIRRLLVALVLLGLGTAAVLVVADGRDDPGARSPSPGPTTRDPRPPATSASPVPPEAQPTAPAATLSPCSAPAPAQVTVVTLNLHFGRAPDGSLALDRVAAELRAWEADVVLLQEVDRGRLRSGRVDQARRLGRLLGMEVALGLNRQVPPGASGNAVLSRHPIIDSGNTPLPGRPGEVARGLLRATLEVDGHRIDVFATHLESTSARTRTVQSRAVVGRVLRSRRPVVLGGDLNSRPERPPVRRLVRAGLVDAWEAAGRGEGFTVPAGSPGRRIDFVLADKSFRVRSADVLLSAVSDHRAVRAELALLPDGCR